MRQSGKARREELVGDLGGAGNEHYSSIAQYRPSNPQKHIPFIPTILHPLRVVFYYLQQQP